MDRVFLTQKLFEAERKVLDAFVEGRRLPVLLNLAAGGLGSPFFFCDVDGDVIATSSDANGAGERWSTLLESRRFDLQQILMGPGTTARETDANEVTMVEFSGGEMVAFTSVRVERTLIGFVGSLGAFSWNDPLLSDYTPMFITALFTTARTWKQLGCPLVPHSRSLLLPGRER